MKKTAKNVLVAFSTLLTSQAFAGHTVTVDGQQGSQVTTLDQLKALCHEYDSNEQIMPFKSSFTCWEERTFWVKTGDQAIPLDNSTRVRVKALLKGSKHQTGWWEVEGTSERQTAMCPVMEQWKTTATFSKVFKCCDQLDQIVSEEQYCREQLAKVWSECDAERVDAQKASGLELPDAPLCQYEATGAVKSCSEDGPVVPCGNTDSCTTSSSATDSASSSSGHYDQGGLDGDSTGSGTRHSTTTSSSSSSAIAQGIYQAAEYTFGAQLRFVRVHRSFWHRQHKVMKVISEPAPGSILAQLGLHKGDEISRINDERVYRMPVFQREIAKAKANGKAKVEFRGANTNGQFVEVVHELM